MKVIILHNEDKTPEENEKNAALKLVGYPIIYHVISLFEKKGFSEFIICDNSKGNKIKTALLEVAHALAGLKITIMNVNPDDKKSEILKKCKDFVLEEAFFVAPNDVTTNIDVEKMLSYHKQNARLATVCIAEEKKHYVPLSFDKAGRCECKIINSGFYVFEPEIFDYMSEGHPLDPNVLMRVAEDDELTVFSSNGFVERCIIEI